MNVGSILCLPALLRRRGGDETRQQATRRSCERRPSFSDTGVAARWHYSPIIGRRGSTGWARVLAVALSARLDDARAS